MTFILSPMGGLKIEGPLYIKGYSRKHFFLAFGSLAKCEHHNITSPRPYRVPVPITDCHGVGYDVLGVTSVVVSHPDLAVLQLHGHIVTHIRVGDEEQQTTAIKGTELQGHVET